MTWALKILTTHLSCAECHAWAGCSQLGKLLVTPERRIVLPSSLPMGRVCLPPKPPGFFLKDFGVAQSTVRRRSPIHPSHRVMADSFGDADRNMISGGVGGPLRRVSVLKNSFSGTHRERTLDVLALAIFILAAFTFVYLLFVR
jgi:hypothetical protein